MPHLRQKPPPPRTTRPHAARHAAPASSHGHLWLWGAVVLILLTGFFFWLTSARVLKEPVHLDYGPGDPAFADAVGPLLDADFLRGNATKILINGDTFFPIMLDAIRKAEKTVTLETYIWTSGKISDQFIEALTERAAHGVKVHIIIDGVGTLHFARSDRARLEKAGVELVTYGREHWYDIKPNINHRTHRKLLIVDGKIGFTGGVCIDDQWLGNADSDKVWRETEIQVQGPAVRQMQATFATNWLQTTSRLLIGEDYFPVVVEAGSSLAECVKSGPGEGQENARQSYMLGIASARKTIDIANAYFVPDDLSVEMLVDARQRGVRVRIILPAFSDSIFGRAASRSRWDRLLAAGVEIYQYLPAMYHCKTMAVDDTFVTVGSVNFDNRSFSINDEVAVNVIDQRLARDHLRMFEDDLKHSLRVNLQEFRHRSIFVKAADQISGLFRSQF